MSTSRRLAPVLAFALGAALLAAPAPARANFDVGVEAMTNFPLSIGLRAWAELPLRIRLGASAGVLPGFYMDFVNQIGTGAGLYEQPTADLLRTSLSSALVMRASAGWRILAERGLYVDVGYGVIALGGGTSYASAVAAASGKPVPEGSGTDAKYQIQGRLQMLDAEVGWQWALTTAFTIRVAVGFAFTFSSSSSIMPAFEPKDRTADGQFTQDAARHLDENSKLFTPTASVGLGWQFF